MFYPAYAVFYNNLRLDFGLKLADENEPVSIGQLQGLREEAFRVARLMQRSDFYDKSDALVYPVYIGAHKHDPQDPVWQLTPDRPEISLALDVTQENIDVETDCYYAYSYRTGKRETEYFGDKPHRFWFFMEDGKTYCGKGSIAATAFADSGCGTALIRQIDFYSNDPTDTVKWGYDEKNRTWVLLPEFKNQTK